MSFFFNTAINQLKISVWKSSFPEFLEMGSGDCFEEYRPSGFLFRTLYTPFHNFCSTNSFRDFKEKVKRGINILNWVSLEFWEIEDVSISDAFYGWRFRKWQIFLNTSWNIIISSFFKYLGSRELEICSMAVRPFDQSNTWLPHKNNSNFWWVVQDYLRDL